MLNTRFAKLAPLVLLTILFVGSGCDKDLHTQAKAGDPVTNNTLSTTTETTSPSMIK